MFAWVFAFVAAHGLGRLRRAPSIEPEPLEDAAHPCWRPADLAGDLLAGQPPAAQRFDPRNRLRRRRPSQPVRPRRAIQKAGPALGTIAF